MIVFIYYDGLLYIMMSSLWVIVYDYITIVSVKGNDSGILIGRKYLSPI